MSALKLRSRDLFCSYWLWHLGGRNCFYIFLSFSCSRSVISRIQNWTFIFTAIWSMFCVICIPTLQSANKSLAMQMRYYFFEKGSCISIKKRMYWTLTHPVWFGRKRTFIFLNFFLYVYLKLWSSAKLYKLGKLYKLYKRTLFRCLVCAQLCES